MLLDIICVILIIVLVYLIIHQLTRGSEKRATWKQQPPTCRSFCQDRDLVFGNHNSKEATWVCVECGNLFPRDSVAGLKQNAQQTSDAVR